MGLGVLRLVFGGLGFGVLWLIRLIRLIWLIRLIRLILLIRLIRLIRLILLVLLGEEVFDFLEIFEGLLALGQCVEGEDAVGDGDEDVALEE